MRIVLDTNVVISALIWGGTPFRLIQAAVDEVVMLCTSPTLLAELRDVLARPHLARRLERQRSSVGEALALYAGLAVAIVPEQVPRLVPADLDDDQVIAAAITARASLVVSGDHHLLDLGNHGNVRIVTPAEALDLIAA